MTFDNNSFMLETMLDDAQKQFLQAKEQIENIENTLKERLGGKSRGGLTAALVVTVIWGVAYVAAFFFMRPYLYGLQGSLQSLLPLGLVLCLALVAAVIVGDLVQIKYFGAILDAQDRLARLRGRVDMGVQALPVNLRAFTDARTSGWEMPLQPGESIIEETGLINSQISALESLSGGVVGKVKTALYYVVCIFWAAAGSYAVLQFAAPTVEGFLDFNINTVHTVMLIAIAIACVIEVIVAKVVWGMTNCAVGNATLLASVLGPVIFVLLLVAVVLVVIVVQIVLAIAAFVIGAACLFGSICGG